MDTQKNRPTERLEPVAEMPGLRIVVGAKQLKKAFASGSVRQVYLAMDADPAITEPIAALCASGNVKCCWISSMTALGRACGIDVGAAAAAMVEQPGSVGRCP